MLYNKLIKDYLVVFGFSLALVFIPNYGINKAEVKPAPQFEWTPESMMPVNRIIDVSLSPKGTSVAYTIKQYQKIDKHWQQAKFIEISSTKDHQNNIQLRQNNEEHS